MPSWQSSGELKTTYVPYRFELGHTQVGKGANFEVAVRGLHPFTVASFTFCVGASVVWRRAAQRTIRLCLGPVA